MLARSVRTIASRATSSRFASTLVLADHDNAKLSLGTLHGGVPREKPSCDFHRQKEKGLTRAELHLFVRES